MAVSDHMVTFGSFSTDGTTLKTEPLHPNWYAFFAGDEIGHVRPILSHAKFMIWDMARGTRSKDLSDNEIAYLMSIAIQYRLQTEIESRYLYRRGLDLETFRKDGINRMPPEVYGDLSANIDSVSLGCKFLICGFDAAGAGHIFVIDDKSAPSSCDSVGFWAIGSGAHPAISSLAFHAQKHNFGSESSLSECLYHLCEAKFMAESSTRTVGKKTFVCVYESDQKIGYLTDRGLKFIRQEWRSKGATKAMPPSIKNIDGEIHRMHVEAWEKEIDAQFRKISKQVSMLRKNRKK